MSRRVLHVFHTSWQAMIKTYRVFKWLYILFYVWNILVFKIQVDFNHATGLFDWHKNDHISLCHSTNVYSLVGNCGRYWSLVCHIIVKDSIRETLDALLLVCTVLYRWLVARLQSFQCVNNLSLLSESMDSLTKGRLFGKHFHVMMSPSANLERRAWTFFLNKNVNEFIL